MRYVINPDRIIMNAIIVNETAVDGTVVNVIVMNETVMNGTDKQPRVRNRIKS